MQHTAFNLCTVVESTAKVESVDLWESRLYIGTSSGDILLYHLEEMEGPGGERLTQSFQETQFRVGAKKAVEQIQSVGELGQLIVMCDGNLTTHDLSTLDQTGSIPAAKGANIFCTNKYGPLYRLCACVKKKLILFEFVGEYVKTKELVIPDTAYSLLWYQSSLCVGYRREYTLVNDETGEVSELFSLDSRTSKPLMKLLPQEELLLGSDDVGVVMDFSALPTRSGIRWSNPPIGLAESFPYVLVLQSKVIEIYNLMDQMLVQAIPFTGGVGMRDDTQRCVVFSPTRVCLLLPVPFSNQISQLLSFAQVQQALELFDKTTSESEKEWRRGEVNEEAAFVYFKTLQFNDAVDLLKESDFDVTEILCYFPSLLPPSLQFHPKNRGLPLDIVEIVREGIKEAEECQPGGAAGGGAGMGGGVGAGEEMMVNLHLEEARTACLNYLIWAREQEKYKKKGDLIDTAIVRLYVQIGLGKSQDLNTFLSLPNKANLSELEGYLKQNKRYNALGLLYKGSGMETSALDVWKKLGASQYVEANEDGVGETVKFLAASSNAQLVYEYSSWVLKRNPAEGIKIFTSEQRQTPLEEAKVVTFLASFSDELYQLFLEYLVFKRKTVNPEFHSFLALHYIATVKTLMPTEVSTGKRVEAGKETGLLGKTRSKLLAFLKESDLIDFEKCIQETDDSDLHEERVIIFMKVSDHITSTHIMVYRLRDVRKAEEYCLTMNAKYGDCNECLLTLLATLIRPHPLYSEMNEEKAAIYLLEAHSSRIDPLKALEIILPNTPIHALNKYLHLILRNTTHNLRDGQIVKNISKMENFQVKCDVTAIRMSYVRITKERNCVFCGKKIADKIFATTPTLQVVHFKCLKDNPAHFDFTEEGKKRKEEEKMAMHRGKKK